jgi:hypothetical protein
MTTRARLESTANNYTESRPDETIDAYPVREDREVLTYGDARKLLALVTQVGRADDLLEDYISEWQDAEPRWAAAMQRIRDAYKTLTTDPEASDGN